ncbi:hypothetical protein D3C80_1222840 [compost metagenome]
MASVTTNTSLATLAMSPTPSERFSAWAISLLRNRKNRLTSRPSRVASVIMPKPPSWNSTRITTWPNADQ